MTNTTVIRELSPGITLFSRPFSRAPMGFKFGARGSVVNLQNGGAVLYGPTELDDATRAKLKELPKVEYIVAPDSVHYMYVDSYKELYPDAKVIGVETLEEKIKSFKLHHRCAEDAKDVPSIGPDIKFQYFPGHGNKELAMYHIPSKTLFQADIFFNLPATEQYSLTKEKPTSLLTSLFTKLPLSKMVTKDKAAMKKDLDTVLGWGINTIVPSHGDVIEKDAEAWAKKQYAFLWQ